MKHEVIKTTRDGKPIIKLKCPKCGIWSAIDDDQFYGRVSIQHECGFHETINLKDEAT